MDTVWGIAVSKRNPFEQLYACVCRYLSPSAIPLLIAGLAAGLKFADRWITVREVLGWRIPGSVVVLSGCETGRSSTDTSEEQYGFGRAFFVAGARGLVVSLWIAHDASTRGLMSEMYRAIAPDAAPSEIHAALVSAQRSQICAGIHPAFWSNFIYLGA